ncbi:protein sorting system archaetidylserine synthase [Halobacterium wangiae]|uniref:protein sorting system archaetidylserine synthase n=1 Tax=Halobacterium wangiae TaxID=2902623 RepID=UPI001E64D8D8|nr:protein sorting system archaetidylserine synthase [Halobacterium wangiae]
MHPRFVGRLGVADAVTSANAALGFVAVVAATVDVELAARLVLLAAIADGLDGLLARRYGSTPAGEHLDSLADVASFGVAPAFIVAARVGDTWGFAAPRALLAVGICALFVAAGVVRLGMYTAYDTGNAHTEGVPTTLAATLLAAGVLAGVSDPLVVVAATGVLTVLMVTTITYPDLYPRDALAMGVVQAAALLAPLALSRSFPRALLAWALAYLLLAPRFYWRAEGKRS